MQIERNTKGKLVFLCISEMQLIFTKVKDKHFLRKLQAKARKKWRLSRVATS